jgi:lysophospholipase L1-like esterase
MRLLLVTDSHGIGMASMIHGLDKDWVVMTVRVSSQTEAVRDRYLQWLAEIRQFGPHRILLHVGHNDLNFHPYHNQDPQHVKELFPFILSFISLLKTNHPMASVWYSSVFPRSTGSRMNEDQKVSYNKLASRFGVLTQSTCRRERIDFTLNGVLWLSVSKAKENPDFFLEDGLHLSVSGQEVVARDWMKKIGNV